MSWGVGGRGRGRKKQALPTPSRDPGITAWAGGRHLTDGAAQVPLQGKFKKERCGNFLKDGDYLNAIT